MVISSVEFQELFIGQLRNIIRITTGLTTIVITDIDEIYDISDLDLIKKIIDEDNLDKYEIDRLIRKIYQIDPANDYLKYIETYIKEEKENINGKKM